MTTEQINAAAENSAGGLRDRPDADSNYERSEHIAGFKSGVKWAAGPQWVLPANVSALLESIGENIDPEACCIGESECCDDCENGEGRRLVWQDSDNVAKRYLIELYRLLTTPAATPQQESHE